jgi:hypothetical protein
MRGLEAIRVTETDMVRPPRARPAAPGELGLRAAVLHARIMTRVRASPLDPRVAHMRLIPASAVALVILALARDLIVGRLG